jgi:LysR family transcriptional activator of nhaA
MDVVPKEIAYRLIEPALRLEMAVRLVCHEANLERLVAELALH